jgi:predicted ATPase
VFSSIRLKNFKAYRDSKKIPLKPLTFIVGANNSGKSSLLHAILLLAQTLEDSTSKQALVTSGTYVDLGGYFDIIWGGQETTKRSFGIDLSMYEQGVESRYAFGNQKKGSPKPTDLSTSFVFNAEKNAIVVSSAKIGGQDTQFVALRRSGAGYTASNIKSKRIRDRLTHFLRHFLPSLQLTGLARRRQMEDDLFNAYFQAEEGWYAWSVEFGRVAHVAPLRQPVPRFGILGKSLTSELGPGGENLLRVLRASDEESESEERLASEVSRWIGDNFKMLKSLELVEVDAAGTILALLGDERNGFSKINLANMGEGLSQLLPIVARVLTTPRYGSLLIEQPELHLHPAAQADLADLFISGAEKADRQYIVETHSEHLLLRLRRRIAEGDVDPEDVAVLYVEREGSESSVRALDLDESGHFDDWPKGFFDERYREALAIAEAAQTGNGKS